MPNEESPAKKYPVFLPRTNFPMKADLPQREPKLVEKWEHTGIYNIIEMVKKNKIHRAKVKAAEYCMMDRHMLMARFILVMHSIKY